MLVRSVQFIALVCALALFPAQAGDKAAVDDIEGISTLIIPEAFPSSQASSISAAKTSPASAP